MRIKAKGDGVVVEEPRGKAPDRQIDEAVGKLRDQGQLEVAVRTLGRRLLAEWMWHRKRERDKHQNRREHLACFGELVQADASTHDWLEGCDVPMALVEIIDDATSRVVARFQ